MPIRSLSFFWILLWVAPAADAGGVYLDLGAGGSYMVTPDLESDLDTLVQAAESQSGSGDYSIDRIDPGANANIGYRFDAPWGLEVGYADLGDVRSLYTANIDNIFGSMSQYQKEILSTTLLSLSATAALPVTDNIEVIGKVGFARWRLREKTERRCTHNNPANTQCAEFVTGSGQHKYRGNSPHLGLGMRYRVNDVLGVRLLWDYYQGIGVQKRTGSMDGNLFTLGMDYRFFSLPEADASPVAWGKGRTYFGAGVSANTLRDYGWGGGWQLFGGAELPVADGGYGVALEAGYAGTGTLQAEQANGGATEAHGFWLAIAGNMLIVPDVHATARVGGDFGNDAGMLSGVGAAYDWSQRYTLQLEYVQRTHLQSLQLNIKYHFKKDLFAWHPAL